MTAPKIGRLCRAALIGVLVVAACSLFAPAARAESAWPFLQVWERTDYPIALGQASRSWYWGQAPIADITENYENTPGGQRQVQYYDKTRMEITNPGGDVKSKWYVTNGLLVREMVKGNVQVGDNSFDVRSPNDIPVAGDVDNNSAPTYADFASFASLNNDNRAQPRIGQPVIGTLLRNAAPGESAGFGSAYPETRIATFENTLGHNIPQVFWDFMNARGTVIVNHAPTQDRIEDWLFAMGYPIAEPYWTKATVGGQTKDVMVQLFQRRVLTYTPSNSAAWRVEMGNVGRHYFQWRYDNLPAKGGPGQSAAFAQPATFINIASIGVNAPIEYVGTKNGDMDVPADPFHTAWYKYGYRIGENGNSVIAAHVDWWTTGPAIFWRLNELRPGARITVSTTQGTRWVFAVTKVESYPNNSAPSQQIFGAASEPHLNLITCTGDFNRSAGEYNRRLVVYSTLVPSESRIVPAQ